MKFYSNLMVMNVIFKCFKITINTVRIFKIINSLLKWNRPIYIKVSTAILLTPSYTCYIKTGI